MPFVGCGEVRTASIATTSQQTDKSFKEKGLVREKRETEQKQQIDLVFLRLLRFSRTIFLSVNDFTQYCVAASCGKSNTLRLKTEQL